MKKREIVERLIEVEKNYLEAKRQIQDLQNHASRTTANTMINFDAVARHNIKLESKIDKLEAQKFECSNSSIIDPNRPKEADSPMIDFRDAVAFHYANAVGKSVVDYIKTNPDKFKSGIIEKKETDTNTQKEDKNTVEVKQTAKKRVYIWEEFNG